VSSQLNLNQLKVALVYDRVNTPYGGAEQVLLALHQLFPNTDLITSVYHPATALWAQEFNLKTSFLQKFPGSKVYHRFYLPFMPLAFENLDLTGYDLVISVTSAEAKGVITKPNQPHLCYLLSPPRYLYSHQAQYLNSRLLFKLPLIRFLVNKLLDYLTWWDQTAAHRPDMIVPISKLVQARVKRYYHLEPHDPVYPPIDVNLQEPQLPTQKITEQLNLDLPKKFILSVARLVTYKRLDLAIKACDQLDQPLVIVGTGPEEKRLKKISQSLNSQTIFLGNQPQSVVNYLYQQAALFLAPGIDDFGIAPVQANYFGTPAVLNQNSGAAELIEHKKQGIHIKELTVNSVKKALQLSFQTEFEPSLLSTKARHYNTEQFLQNFKNVVKKLL
jgi:glycosyltransferase involved in cell wall biosynthesis